MKTHLHLISVAPAVEFDPAEAMILANLGGTPWAGPLPGNLGLKEARRRLADLRKAVGYSDTSDARWLTTETAKFAKGLKKAKGDVTAFAGLTLHPARSAARVWLSLEPGVKGDLAAALGVSVADVERALRPTVCMHATPACTAGCVVAHSHRGTHTDTEKTRLLRQLLVLFHPAAAFELTHHALAKLADKHGADKVRWRTNIGDDLRWELLAPGLFTLGIPAYAYTKHPVTKRANRPDLRIVYSVNERWSDAEIIAACRAGHTVAVVFDVPKKAPLPSMWRGVTVVDGDATDDLTTHPDGVIVGLSVKGKTLAVRRHMADTGFARPAA